MTKLILPMAVMLAFITCSRSADNSGTVKIRMTDSLIYVDERPQVETDYILAMRYSRIVPQLADELDAKEDFLHHVTDSLVTRAFGDRTASAGDSARFLDSLDNIFHRRCVITSDPGMIFHTLHRIIYTCARRSYNDIRLRSSATSVDFHYSGMEPETRVVGIGHTLMITSRGFCLGEMKKPFVRYPGRLALASADSAVTTYFLVPKRDGQFDFAALERELNWIASELKTIGYRDGRHVEIRAEDTTGAETVVRTISAVHASLNEKIITTTQAGIGFTDLAPGVPGLQRRKIKPAQGRRPVTSATDSSSISLGEVPNSALLAVQNDTVRQSLLCLNTILIHAVTENNIVLAEEAIRRGADKDAYVEPEITYNDSIVGFTPLLLARRLGLNAVEEKLTALGSKLKTRKFFKPKSREYNHLLDLIGMNYTPSK